MIDMTNKGLDETVWLVGGMMRFGLLRHNNSSTQPSEHLAVFKTPPIVMVGWDLESFITVADCLGS